VAHGYGSDQVAELSGSCYSDAFPVVFAPGQYSICVEPYLRVMSDIQIDVVASSKLQIFKENIIGIAHKRMTKNE
jgi:hypothetical protein